jgi:hypothetical protein
MMKKAIALLLLAVASMNAQDKPVVAEAAPDNEKAWSISLDQSFSDKYVWRGIQYNEEGVNQGSLDVAYDFGDIGTIGVNVWYNLDLDNENGQAGNFSEVDYTLYWEKSFDKLTLGAGYIYYDFSEVDLGSTREVYVSASYDVLLAPSVTVYYDIEDVDGFYVDFAISHSFDLEVAGMSLDLGANIGWADENMTEAYYTGGSDADSGFTNYALSAGLNIPVGDYVTITPSITYFSLLQDAETDSGYEDDDFIYAINVNVSF